MIRRPPRSTRTDTLFPYTTLFLSADRVCAEVSGNGGEARAFHGDVGSEEDVRAMVDAAVSAFGGLQGAVNAAGVPQVGKLLHDVDIEEWDRCHRVNLSGLFICNKSEAASSEERSVGKEGVSTGRTRGTPYH